MSDPIEIPNMNAAAAFHHEMFVSYVKAGFTETQALELIKAWILRPTEGGADTT